MALIFPPILPPPTAVQRIDKAEFMASNRKLSALLKGRIVQEITMQSDRVFLLFGDGSNLQIKTAAPVVPGSITVPPGPVRAVRQNNRSIMLDFEPAPAAPPNDKLPDDKLGEGAPDQSAPQSQVEAPEENAPKTKDVALTITFNTLEATACVMLRDAKGVLEYAD